MGKGLVTESMRSSRITRHGKIASLATDFELPDKAPFSIFIIPKVDNDTIQLHSVLLYQDDAAGNCPFKVKEWNPVSIQKLVASEALTDNDIYWGA